MLFKLFKSNHPSVIFLIPILGILLWAPTIFSLPFQAEIVRFERTTWVYNWFLNLFSFYPKASVIFALILIIIQSYIIIRLNFKYMFLDNKTYLPSVFFVLLSSMFAAYQSLHPLLIANLFLLLALDKALLFEKSKNHFKRYFESGFFLGLGTLFYPNIFVLIFVVWLTMIYLRTFNWREWLSSVLGLITPLMLYAGFLFLTDNIQILSNKIPFLFAGKAPEPGFSQYSLFAMAYLLFVFIIAIVSGARVVGLRKISSRKYFSLFFLMVIGIIALVFAVSALGFEFIISLAIPLSIICSIFFSDIRSKWVGEVLFTLTLVSVIVIICLQ